MTILFFIEIAYLQVTMQDKNDWIVNQMKNTCFSQSVDSLVVCLRDQSPALRTTPTPTRKQTRYENAFYIPCYHALSILYVQ